MVDEYRQYEGKRKTAELLGLIATAMYGLNWFLGFCALTWASAVILGGLVANLRQNDYFSIVALLLLEAVRLSTTTFFAKFVTRKLINASANPQFLVYNDIKRQRLKAFAGILEEVLMLTVFAISIVVPIRRLKDLNEDLDVAPAPSANSASHVFDGTKTSLRIFYVLVLINGAIASLAVIFSKSVVPFFVDSFSLCKYLEKIVWKGMDEGLLHATDFEFLAWTFQMQADEYRRNVRPSVVKDLYGDLMEFLYFHPRYKGFEAAKVALESEDTYEREAAANIVGLWVSLVRGGAGSEQHVNRTHVLDQMLMQEKLLTKLAEVLDNDETGRAASSSFQALAKSYPEGLLKVRIGEKNEKVEDMLMNCIHKTLQVGRPNNTLVYMKAMIPLLDHLKDEEGSRRNTIEDFTQEKWMTLREDVRTIVFDYQSARKRVQAVAAHVYNLLSSREEEGYQDPRARLKEGPAEKEHMLEDEQKYLFKLLGEDNMPATWGEKVEVRRIEEGTRGLHLPWLARPTTALLATFLIVALISVSSSFISRLAHF